METLETIGIFILIGPLVVTIIILTGVFIQAGLEDFKNYLHNKKIVSSKKDEIKLYIEEVKKFKKKIDPVKN